MEITMIAAMDRRRTIGGPQGGIPWHLPRDSAHFRRFTQERHMLLGRRTFEEMEGWFTTQTPIVLTRDSGYRPGIGHTATSIESSISLARDGGESNLIVAGGATVYRLVLPHATQLVLTLVDAEVEVPLNGRAVFPDWSEEEWSEVSRESFPADEENEYRMSIVVLTRSDSANNQQPVTSDQ